MNKIILNIILFIHLSVMLFIIVTPFIDSNYFLLMHCIIVPFIMLHWFLNDNTCILSIMEKKIREHITGKKINKDDCFTSRIINPIYDFKANNEDWAHVLYIVTTGLWLISTSKLYFKYKTGEIRTIYDFKIY